MRNLALSRFAAIVLLATAAGSTLSADPPKQGSFTAKFGYFATTKVYEIDKGHMLVAGEWSGTSFNDAGSGMLHGAATMCPGMVDIQANGEHYGHGYCVFTDAAGDKVYSTWECKGPLPCNNGTATFTGGTGKYAGIKGGFTWQNSGTAVQSPSGQMGYNSWSAKYQLP